MLRKFWLYVLPYKLVIHMTKTHCAACCLSAGKKTYPYWDLDEDHLLLQKEWEIKLSEKKKRNALKKQNKRISKAEKKKRRAENELEKQERLLERIAALDGKEG